MDRYLKDEEQENLKGMLYSYLKDKAARRADVTSKNAYEGGEKAFVDQMALHDVGSFLGAMSEGAAMAGSLNGKIAQSNIIPKMNDALYKTTQGAYENFRTLRGMEERSNMNDLRVADYITGIESRQDANKINSRDRDFREQQYKDGIPDRELKRKILQKQLEQKAAQKRSLNNDIMGPNGQPVLLDNEGNPTNLDGYKFRPERAPTASAGTWEILKDAKGPKGTYLMRNNKTGEVKSDSLPVGYEMGVETKGDDKANIDMAKLNETDAQKKLQIAGYLDKELEVYRNQVNAKNFDQAQMTGRNMVKGLNSVFGPDAVGVEESKRLAGALEMFKAPWQPGSMIGRDFDMFDEQVAQKSNAMKAAARSSMERAKRIRSGDTSIPDDTPPAQSAGPKAPPAGKVRVKNITTGKIGFVSPQFIDPTKYEVMP